MTKKPKAKKIHVERYKTIPIYLKEGMFHVTIPGGMSFGCERIKDAKEHVDDHFREAEQIAEKERKAKEAEAKNRKLMKTAWLIKGERSSNHHDSSSLHTYVQCTFAGIRSM